MGPHKEVHRALERRSKCSDETAGLNAATDGRRASVAAF
jgi:hypothetical protein